MGSQSGAFTNSHGLGHGGLRRLDERLGKAKCRWHQVLSTLHPERFPGRGWQNLISLSQNEFAGWREHLCTGDRRKGAQPEPPGSIDGATRCTSGPQLTHHFESQPFERMGDRTRDNGSGLAR